MAAALVFALPGIPMIYQGQEIGSLHHPYSPKPIFQQEHTIEELDSLRLREHFKTHIELRKSNPALAKGTLLPCEEQEEILAFWRILGDEKILCLFNLASTEKRVDLSATLQKLNIGKQEISAKNIIDDQVLTRELADNILLMEKYQYYFISFQEIR